MQVLAMEWFFFQIL